MTSLIYIAGHGRSGSTALEQVLALETNGIPLGEAVHLFGSDERFSVCRCAQSLVDCEFWSPIIAAATSVVNRPMSDIGHVTKRLNGWNGKARAADVALYERAWYTVFQELATLFPGRTFIDASKSAHGQRRMIMLSELAVFDEMTVIHLRRPLAGVMQAYMKGSNIKMRDEGQLEYSASTISQYKDAVRAAFGWGLTERRTPSLVESLHSSPGSLITTHKIDTADYLAQHPNGTGLMQLLEIPDSFANATPHQFQHTIGGNRLLRGAGISQFRPPPVSRQLPVPLAALARLATRISTH